MKKALFLAAVFAISGLTFTGAPLPAVGIKDAMAVTAQAMCYKITINCRVSKTRNKVQTYIGKTLYEAKEKANKKCPYIISHNNTQRVKCPKNIKLELSASSSEAGDEFLDSE